MFQPLERTPLLIKKGENFTAVIDGFLVSDNIEVISVKAHSMDFKNTDHNPVNMKFKLK